MDTDTIKENAMHSWQVTNAIRKHHGDAETVTAAWDAAFDAAADLVGDADRSLITLMVGDEVAHIRPTASGDAMQATMEVLESTRAARLGRCT